MPLLTPNDIADVTPEMTEAQREGIIEMAEALAAHYAPCLRAETVAPHIAATAKAIIKKAIAYDVQIEAQGGATKQTEQLGPYQVSHFSHRSGTFYSPAQIDVLRSLCGSGTAGAYSVPLDVPDTLPGW